MARTRSSAAAAASPWRPSSPLCLAQASLPRSTVDGIRQELRAVTQELIQRRMGAAAAVVACGGTAVPEGPAAGATQGPFLQPRTSLPVLEATSSVPSRPPGAPMQLGSASCVSAPPGHSGHPHTSVLHKRPSTGPDGSSTFSPPRIRPAPSAPAANVFAAAFGHAGAAAPLPISGPDAGVSRSNGGAGTCSTAVPASMKPPLLYASDLCGASQPPVGSPPAMRQLFPGPAGPGAPAFGMRPSSASAPLAGPRPTMSGSTASVCHSASGAHPLPPMPTVAAQRMEEGRSAHQQPQQVQAQAAQSQHPHLQQLQRPQSHPHQQHQLQPQQHVTHLPQGSSAAAPMANRGAYQVGQQGSVAAEAEGEVEGGEEVHGPDTATAMWIHRNSTTNGGTSAGGGVGGSSAAVTGAAQPPSARVAAAGPGPGAPPAAGYYPPPPGPYDYHGYGAYYPPPPHAVYGSRPGYGMYPPPTYGVPPPGSYRGGMYGMHPPPPTYGPTAWPDYCMPLPGSGAPPPGAPRS